MIGMNKLPQLRWGGGRGFTLAELMVALGAFVILITAVTSIYLTAIEQQRRAFGRQNVLDNSRFVLEKMSRAVRESEIVSVGGSSLEINHPTEGNITYTLDDGRLEENGTAITGGKVEVEGLSFIPTGLGSGDAVQERVTILLSIRSITEKSSEEARINVQTTVTVRNLDL